MIETHVQLIIPEVVGPERDGQRRRKHAIRPHFDLDPGDILGMCEPVVEWLTARWAADHGGGDDLRDVLTVVDWVWRHLRDEVTG